MNSLIEKVSISSNWAPGLMVLDGQGRKFFVTSSSRYGWRKEFKAALATCNPSLDGIEETLVSICQEQKLDLELKWLYGDKANFGTRILTETNKL